jgi:hypothetical protein
MKLLGILILVPLQILAQGTWRQVSIPEGKLEHIDFFEGDKGYIVCRNDTGYFSGGASFDTIYYTENGTENWNVFSSFITNRDVFWEQTNRYDFTTPTDWHYIATLTEREEGSIESFQFFQGHLPRTLPKIPQLDTFITSATRSTIHFDVTNDNHIYAHYFYPYEGSLFYLGPDSSLWTNLFPQYNISGKIALNKVNKDYFIYLYDSLNGFTAFIPGSDISKLRVVNVPLGLPTHIADSFWMSSKNNLYAITSDNGTTWSATDSVGEPIKLLRFTPDGYGYMSTGTINLSSLYRTTNYGRTWTPQFLGQSFSIFDISIVDSLVAYFSNGKLFKTIDGGGSTLLGVQTQKKQNSEIIIVPNPIQGTTFRVEFPFLESNEYLIITDLLGIAHIPLAIVNIDHAIVNIACLPAGVYTVAVGRHREKFIRK